MSGRARADVTRLRVRARVFPVVWVQRWLNKEGGSRKKFATIGGQVMVES